MKWGVYELTSIWVRSFVLVRFSDFPATRKGYWWDETVHLFLWLPIRYNQTENSEIFLLGTTVKGLWIYGNEAFWSFWQGKVFFLTGPFAYCVTGFCIRQSLCNVKWQKKREFCDKPAKKKLFLIKDAIFENVPKWFVLKTRSNLIIIA